MASAPRKICVLGAGGTGKSLLAGRIALGADDCGTAPRDGTRVLSSTLEDDRGRRIAVRLWDGPGKVALDSLSQPLLVHAAAWLLVADGTSAESVELLALLHAGASALVGARPALVLLNKHDLASRWNPGELAPLRRLGPVLVVSALTGEGVDAARSELARLLY